MSEEKAVIPRFEVAFTVKKSHEVDGITVIDEAEIKSVSLVGQEVS